MLETTHRGKTALALCATLGVVAIVVAANLGLLPRMLGNAYDLPAFDKVAHFLLIGTLAFLADGALVRRLRLGGVSFPMGSALVTIAVTLEEISQLFLRHRTFSLTDLLCDYAGIVVAVALRAMTARD